MWADHYSGPVTLGNHDTYAQNGRWVEYELQPIGASAGQAARGDGIVGFAATNAPYVLVFDVDVGDWLTAELNEIHDFDEFDSEGDLLFGADDELLFGYSAETQTGTLFTCRGLHFPAWTTSVSAATWPSTRPRHSCMFSMFKQGSGILTPMDYPATIHWEKAGQRRLCSPVVATTISGKAEGRCLQLSHSDV